MSYWSDLEADVNPVMAATFGMDPVHYTDVAGHTFDLVVVPGNPPHADGGQVAFTHVWALATAFQQPPEAGDKFETSDGKTLTIFSVHAESVDGQFEPNAYWLSANKTS